MQENLFFGFENNKSVDQLVHSHSLIKAFVLLSLHSILSMLAIRASSIFELISAVQQAGSGMTWSETSKVFLRQGPIISVRL